MLRFASQPVRVFAVRPITVSRQRTEPGGFTLVEVLVAVAILTIGLMASALLMSDTYKYSVRSRYMAEAAQLASEKLKDLSRFPVVTSSGTVTVDSHVFVPAGANDCGLTGVSCVGTITPALTCVSTGNCTFVAAADPLSITANDPGAGSTVAKSTVTVSYSDGVYLSYANGTISETYQTAGGSSPTYSTLSYSPNGLTPVATNSTTAPTGGETFDRRWVIEQDQPLAGVRRITVLVTLLDVSIQPSVTYQMSMVRP